HRISAAVISNPSAPVQNNRGRHVRRAPSIRFSRRCALHRIHGTKPPFRSSRKMKHRDIEYTLVQGVGRHIWKWSVVLDGSRSAAGQAMSKAEAVSEAERAIDRGAGPQKDETGPAHN